MELTTIVVEVLGETLTQPYFVFFVLGLLAYLRLFAMERKLRHKLNPVFDPVLLPKILGRFIFYRTFSPECLRASHYARYLANPKLLKGVELPMGYSMRAQVDEDTYRQCLRYHRWHNATAILFILSGAFLLLKNLV